MTPLVMLLVLATVGWFAAGTFWNVRKGSAAMRWMQGGLPILGERTTVRWLGSTSVELGIQRARAPFAEVALVVFLEPRDVPWLWILGRSRGRRDTLIVRGVLRGVPGCEGDAIDPRSWSGRDALRTRGSFSRPRGIGPGELWIQPGDGTGLIDAALRLARGARMAVRRLSIQGTRPHLQLHVDLPGLNSDATAFFQAIRDIGERALG